MAQNLGYGVRNAGINNMDTLGELVMILKRTRQENVGIPLYEIVLALKESLAQEEIDYIIKDLTNGK